MVLTYFPLCREEVQHLFMNEPEYECALFSQRCLKLGNTVVLLKSNIETGSPTYLILPGLVLVSDVTLLAKSVETFFLPISAPIPVNKPPSLKPKALSADAPIANPPAAPAVTISSLTMFLNNGFEMLPDTVGAPNVLLCIIPYGLLPSFLYFFSIAKLTAPQRP